MGNGGGAVDVGPIDFPTNRIELDRLFRGGRNKATVQNKGAARRK